MKNYKLDSKEVDIREYDSLNFYIKGIKFHKAENGEDDVCDLTIMGVNETNISACVGELLNKLNILDKTLDITIRENQDGSFWVRFAVKGEDENFKKEFIKQCERKINLLRPRDKYEWRKHRLKGGAINWSRYLDLDEEEGDNFLPSFIPSKWTKRREERLIGSKRGKFFNLYDTLLKGIKNLQ